MQLSDYPRPAGDNGRGIHWSARPTHPRGRDLDFWIAELTAMHIKWVKLLDNGDGSSLELCRRLLESGMMPIVRFYREATNSKRLAGHEVNTLRKLVAAGVRYFETNHEPDRPAAWANGQRPSNWVELVSDDFIYNAGIVLKEGGLPAIPALETGAGDVLVRQVIDKDRADLFQKGAWLAIHTYTLNYPLTFPDDPVNQEGKLLARHEYESLPAWAWDNRSLEAINEQRATHKRPGQALDRNVKGFRTWEWAGKAVHDLLGYPIPVLSTEGGPVVGRGDDLRYPKVTPDHHAQLQVEIVRFLQERAPAWYFTCCSWLLASRPLGDWDPHHEQMSWYTDAWNEQFGLAGQLPVVQAMKDLPPQIRRGLRQETASLSLSLVRAERNEPLPETLVAIESVAEDMPVRRFQARSNAEGRLKLEQMPAGEYRLLVFNTEVNRLRLAQDERQERTVSIEAGRRSAIEGKITDSNGLPQPDLLVTLHQTSPLRLLAETRSDAQGLYAFKELPAGKVMVRVAPGTEQSTEQHNIVLNGWETVTVDFTVPPAVRRRYVVKEKRLLAPDETGNDNLIFGQVLDETGAPLDGVTVRMRWAGAGPDTVFPTVKSGQNQFKPRGYFEFIHTPGVFHIDLLDPEVESQVAEDLVTANMPGRSRPISYEVIFQRKPGVQAGNQSTIQGRILGGPPNLIVALIGANLEPRWQRPDANGNFTFGELAAGTYQLSLAGVGLIGDEIVLDGAGAATVEFPMNGQIAGMVLPAEQPATVVLTSDHYSIYQEDATDEKGAYRFDHLPEDRYTLFLKESNLPARSVSCNGRGLVTGPTFDRDLSEQSTIAGRITDHQGSPVATTIVWLRTLGQRVREAQTDGEGRYRFEKLGAGAYSLELVGVGLLAENLRVDGVQALTQDIQLPPPAQCAIEGRLLDANEQPVANRSLQLKGPIERQTQSSKDGTFRFADLPAGEYSVHVADLPQVKATLTLDRAERKRVVLHLPATPAQVTGLGHYLLIATPDTAMATSQLTAALDYIQRTTPAVGFRRQDCLQARKVTIIGTVEETLLQRLRAKAIPVHQVTGKLETLRAELEALP